MIGAIKGDTRSCLHTTVSLLRMLLFMMCLQPISCQAHEEYRVILNRIALFGSMLRRFHSSVSLLNSYGLGVRAFVGFFGSSFSDVENEWPGLKILSHEHVGAIPLSPVRLLYDPFPTVFRVWGGSGWFRVQL